MSGLGLTHTPCLPSLSQNSPNSKYPISSYGWPWKSRVYFPKIHGPPARSEIIIIPCFGSSTPTTGPKYVCARIYIYIDGIHRMSVTEMSAIDIDEMKSGDGKSFRSSVGSFFGFIQQTHYMPGLMVRRRSVFGFIHCTCNGFSPGVSFRHELSSLPGFAFTRLPPSYLPPHPYLHFR